MVCSAASGAAFGVIGTASRAKKTKRDVQLDHLHAPIFVYIRKGTIYSTISVSA